MTKSRTGTIILGLAMFVVLFVAACGPRRVPAATPTPPGPAVETALPATATTAAPVGAPAAAPTSPGTRTAPTAAPSPNDPCGVESITKGAQGIVGPNPVKPFYRIN